MAHEAIKILEHYWRMLHARCDDKNEADLGNYPNQKTKWREGLANRFLEKPNKPAKKQVGSVSSVFQFFQMVDMVF